MAVEFPSEKRGKLKKQKRGDGLGSSGSPFEEGTEGVCGRRKGSDPVQGEVRIQLKKKKIRCRVTKSKEGERNK